MHKEGQGTSGTGCAGGRQAGLGSLGVGRGEAGGWAEVTCVLWGGWEESEAKTRQGEFRGLH